MHYFKISNIVTLLQFTNLKTKERKPLRILGNNTQSWASYFPNVLRYILLITVF